MVQTVTMSSFCSIALSDTKAESSPRCLTHVHVLSLKGAPEADDMVGNLNDLTVDPGYYSDDEMYMPGAPMVCMQ